MIDPLNDTYSRVELLETMGTDLTVVNSARVSFAKQSVNWGDKDDALLRFLLRHQHTSPFRQAFVRFRFKAPIFLARQFYKHAIGIETSEAHKDHGWNEVSYRYVEAPPEFYIPTRVRGQAASNRQASEDSLSEKDKVTASRLMRGAVAYAEDTYQELLSMGVAREQARSILPTSTYTEWVWAMSLQAALHFISLRSHEGAQWEAQRYALAMETLLEDVFPATIRAWKEVYHEGK